MNTKRTPTSQILLKNVAKPGMSGIQKTARLTFVDGPRQLFTSRLNLRSATLTIFLCVPALLLFVSMNVPTLLFSSPDQEAYFYFARSLSQDLSGTLPIILSAICVFFAMALPATRTNPFAMMRG